MKGLIPRPGDLINVDFSEWEALPDGDRLRVCESTDWIDEDSEIRVAPRQKVKTFWGPATGLLDGTKPMVMSTSGGPFKNVRLANLEALERIGQVEDRFWCWSDVPRANGGIERVVTVTLWRAVVLVDGHFRAFKASGCWTHRDRLIH